ncbi:MAG TPA: hypothetical protein VJU82_08955 [Acidobacteriaceae bacterium]|nr:hypothetical protein [Acidobacteriaceae bacterium]
MFSLESEAEIERALGEVALPVPFRIRFRLLYSPESVRRIFWALAQDRRLNALPNKALGFSLNPLDGAHSGLPFGVLSTSQANVQAVASVSTRDEWNEVSQLVRRQYPSLVPIYLSQRELRESVSILRKRVESAYELRIREFSAKEVIRTSRGEFERTLREWTDEDWERALADAATRGQTFTKISFAIHSRVGGHVDVFPAALFKISRTGEIDCTGRFDLVWRHVVPYVAEIGQRKLTSYARRGLRERDYKAAPLAIAYSQPLFADVSEVRRLVEVLRGYPHSMHSVQHGNPYAYVQVSDAFDGSSFDVWALSPERITIVPRLKSTEAAVNRLIHFLFEHFREGTVEEHGEHTGR